MNNKLRAALFGGAVIGILSGIPYVRLGNVLCCLWVVIGGAFATYLYAKQSPVQVNVGDGALIGAMAGAIGTVLQLIIGIPLTILMGNPEGSFLIGIIERLDPQKAEYYRQQMEEAMSLPFSEQFFGSLLSLRTLLLFLITMAFALVGGLIAVPLFEKRKAEEGIVNRES
ncbi:MAG TPA: hypothetical protein VF791_20755 [Pyrinomonadaceae bacterium]